MVCVLLRTRTAQAAFQQLSFKLQSLFTECFAMHTFPEITKKLVKFEACVHNPTAQLLLKRGRRWVGPTSCRTQRQARARVHAPEWLLARQQLRRRGSWPHHACAAPCRAHYSQCRPRPRCCAPRRLIEQTLDTCQLKRVRASVVRVDLRWLCTHLQRWNLLGRDFNLQELVIIAIFAKQVGGGARWRRAALAGRCRRGRCRTSHVRASAHRAADACRARAACHARSKRWSRRSLCCTPSP